MYEYETGTLYVINTRLGHTVLEITGAMHHYMATDAKNTLCVYIPAEENNTTEALHEIVLNKDLTYMFMDDTSDNVKYAMTCHYDGGLI